MVSMSVQGKWVGWVGLALALGFVGLAQDTPEASAWQVTEPVTVDGSLEEWNKSAPVTISKASQLTLGGYLWGGSYDLSATIYLMWDADNLYIGAEIQDDVPFTARPGFKPDEADSIGIYLSTNPAADPGREAYEPTDFRILLMTDGYDFYTAIDRDMLQDPMGIETGGMYGDEQVIEGYEAAVVETRRGCVFEAKIPWSALASELIPKFTPEPGVKVGFDLEINDIDMPCPGVESKSMAWTGSSAIRTSPAEWGVLVFQAAE